MILILTFDANIEIISRILVIIIHGKLFSAKLWLFQRCWRNIALRCSHELVESVESIKVLEWELSFLFCPCSSVKIH